MNKIYKFIDEKIKIIKKDYEYLFKPFLILIVSYLITYYPIFRANFYYADDLQRAAFGIKGWNNFSRFTSDFLSGFFHTSNYLTDISPLTQIIAIIFLALSGIIILHLFKKQKKITFLNILSVLPIGLTPYFLSCISYKYDSPYMALSIFASIIPFIFYKNKKKDIKIFSIFLVIGTIIMCTTYQAASGIIPLMTIFLSYNYWENKKEKDAINLIIYSFISFFIGLLIFKFFIMVPANYYASNTMFSIKDMIPGFFGNLYKYYYNLFNDFRNILIIFIASLLVIFIYIKTINNKNDRIISFIVTLFLIFLSFLMMFGLYPCLEKTIFDARSMYSVGIFISLICINISRNKNLYISKMIIFCLVYCFISFSFTYGNALSAQKNHIEFRVNQVLDEINELEIMKEPNQKYLKIEGSIGNAHIIETMPNEYTKLMNRLVPQSFGGNGTWHMYYFQHYFKLKNTLVLLDNAVEPEDLEIYKDTMYYSIYTNEKDYILLILN